MPGNVCLTNVQGIKKLSDVLNSRRSVVTCGWNIGFAEASPSQRDDAECVNKVAGEPVEDMRVIAQPCEKEQWLAIPTPVQVVQLDSVDQGEAAFVWL
jgi:hypothetical protein